VGWFGRCLSRIDLLLRNSLLLLALEMLLHCSSLFLLVLELLLQIIKELLRLGTVLGIIVLIVHECIVAAHATTNVLAAKGW
jgi:hypothetical protein